MATETAEKKDVSTIIQDSVEIVDQVSEYGFLVTESLLHFITGMIIVFTLHTLAVKFIYPYIQNRRLIKVVFGTIYVLILVIVILMILRKLGFDVHIIGKISILAVLVSAVAVFFLVPFIPRLPFKIGNMVEINGVLGSVDSITTYHTTLRKFDGTMVFIPNAIVMATKILNFHDTPERRIELNISLDFNSDISEFEEKMIKIMVDNKHVLTKPAIPSLIATNTDVMGIKYSAYCWVKNADWLSTRSELWREILNEFSINKNISMSRPQQDVYVVDKTN
jgi:small conductance mechanosensitive channel